MTVEPLLFAGCVIVLSRVITGWLSTGGSLLHIVDVPNDRSLHERPTPKTGGVAVVGSFLFTLLLAAGVGAAGLEGRWPALLPGIGGMALLALTSLWNDWRELSVSQRLPIHLVAVCGLLLGGLAPEGVMFPGVGLLPLGVAGVPFTLLYALWLINLYNFMDGMDGFAGGMGLFGFGALALLGGWHGHEAFSTVALLLAAANSGFLMVNFPPAKIFMGDVGSIPMGFAVAWMGLWGVREGLFELWVPVLLFSNFIVDATVTLFRRMLRGEKIWRPHREHFYQRLVRLGWGHRKTVLAEYGVMVAVGLSTLLLHLSGNPTLQGVGIGSWILIYILLARRITALEQQRPHPEGRQQGD